MGKKNGSLRIRPSITKEVNLEPTEFNITYNGDSQNVLRIGGWSDNYWTPVGTYYYVKVFDESDNLMFDGIPCYKKSNREIGIYDLIENGFYTNQGTEEFVAGPEI